VEALEILADHLKRRGYLVQLVQAGWHPDYGSAPELRITRYAPGLGWWTKDDIEVTFNERDCTITANLDGQENYSKAYTSITVSLYDPKSIPQLEMWIQRKAYPSANLVAKRQVKKLKRIAKVKVDFLMLTFIVLVGAIAMLLLHAVVMGINGRIN
jgi:hypothetical protein